MFKELIDILVKSIKINYDISITLASDDTKKSNENETTDNKK